MPEPLLTPKQAAEFLGVPLERLADWRRARNRLGPPFIAMSQRTVRYRVKDLERYLRERTKK